MVIEQSQHVSSFWNGQEVLATLRNVDEVPFELTSPMASAPKEEKQKRSVGKALLNDAQASFLSTHMLDMVPSELPEFGFTEGFWTPKIVQELVRKQWSIDLSLATARNYIKRLGFGSPKALPRQTGTSDAIKGWLSDRLPSLRVLKKADVDQAKGSAKKRPIVWLSCKAQQGDLLREQYVQLHAVANTGKTAFVSLTDSDQEAQAANFLESLADKKTLFVFDDSVIEHFGTYALKGKASPDPLKYGATNAKHVMRLKVFRYLKKLMPRDVIPVGYNPLDDVDDSERGGAANSADMSDRELDKFADYFATRLIELAFEGAWVEKKKLVDGEPSRDDNVAWITSESDEVRSFNWCVSFLGLRTRGQREAFRAAGLRQAASNKGIDPAIRKELLDLADEYA